MEPETIWDYEPKGKYYKFESRADGRVTLEPVRVPAHVLEEQREKMLKKQRIRSAQKNRQREMYMNRAFIAFIACAAAVCCLVCYIYVSIQSEVQSRIQSVSQLQIQLEDLTAENDILESRIAGSEDITVIREFAENELEMTLAGEDQIVYYTVPDVDYMMQYGDIEE